MGILQKEAAAQIGVSEATFYNWEGKATTPLACYLPRIIAFLGYDPIEEPTPLPNVSLRRGESRCI
jgi:DNA-binding XRE family transcriptional regulator